VHDGLREVAADEGTDSTRHAGGIAGRQPSQQERANRASAAGDTGYYAGAGAEMGVCPVWD
jgi:hypothetical protein